MSDAEKKKEEKLDEIQILSHKFKNMKKWVYQINKKVNIITL